MATPDVDEMEQLQRLSDQYQADLPARLSFQKTGALADRVVGSIDWKQEASIRSRHGICSGRPGLCGQDDRTHLPNHPLHLWLTMSRRLPPPTQHIAQSKVMDNAAGAV